MANFFSDNEDILFNFNTAEWPPVVRAVEGDFSDAQRFPYAPESVEDAVDNYRRVLAMVGQLAGENIAPRSEAIDREGNRMEGADVRRPAGMCECLDLLAKADLMGFTLPRRYGGINFPNLAYCMAIEMVSRADASLMNIFGLQGIAETINAFADDQIKSKYLPLFSAGKITGAMALTEPDAGSDLQNVQLKAFQDEEGAWRLNGVKRFITNGCGEVLLVLARSEPEEGGLGLSLYLCEKQPEVWVRRIEEKLGIHGSPTCELQFNDAKAFLIGERRRGLVTYVMALMNGARIGIAAQALGIAEAAYNEARSYAYTRQQFGKRIQAIPEVADLLAEMKIDLEGARALTYETSHVVDRHFGAMRIIEGGIADKEAVQAARQDEKHLKRLAALLTPMAKYYSSEMANRVASAAIQVLGGSGYMRDYPVERHFRDARITNIYEGTSQLQIVAAVRGVTSGVAEKNFEEKHQALKGSFPGILRQLAQARGQLTKAVEFAKKKGLEYTDLYARDLVDMAGDIEIGYLFARQALNSKRKAILARRWARRALARARMKCMVVTSGDRTSIRNFELIAGPLRPE